MDVWEKDISVHPLPLPQGSCEELQKLLMSSTFRLPAFLRCMNSYQVTYLVILDCLVIIVHQAIHLRDINEKHNAKSKKYLETSICTVGVTVNEIELCSGDIFVGQSVS